MRVLVVDDEPLARLGVLTRLAAMPDIEIVGECGAGLEAVAAIRQHAPDLVFLDVQMPDVDGFGVLEALAGETLPLVVFLTAYDRFALRAFDIHAVDYLLKPIDDERFAEAVRRARAAMMLRDGDAWQQRLLDMLAERNGVAPRHAERFAIRTGSRVAFVAAAEIDWIEAMGDYAGLHVADKTHLLREPLHTLVNRLDPRCFLRVHRSAIVRLDRVAELRTLPNRDGELQLKDGTRLRVSRSYSDALRKALAG
ncbi:sensory transduction protein lytT [Mizugakiibacter sediminis]|uniref:Sensory transduction protein lytT n=1 Tax=Mizugakiibacter sediminis TaxID=1475481 RepID=A0A0K8QRC5_9GAMM|nr:sensory transduction protein lytT [Mizugakiibacter sediminis]